jgi:hypothetical protein
MNVQIIVAVQLPHSLVLRWLKTIWRCLASMSCLFILITSSGLLRECCYQPTGKQVKSSISPEGQPADINAKL